MENTFCNISQNGNLDFVELFKKSFTLYVESGMRKETEADIVILQNQSGYPVIDKFKTKFCKIINEHCLVSVFLCFLFALQTSFKNFLAYMQPTL